MSSLDTYCDYKIFNKNLIGALPAEKKLIKRNSQTLLEGD